MKKRVVAILLAAAMVMSTGLEAGAMSMEDGFGSEAVGSEIIAEEPAAVVQEEAEEPQPAEAEVPEVTQPVQPTEEIQPEQDAESEFDGFGSQDGGENIVDPAQAPLTEESEFLDEGAIAEEAEAAGAQTAEQQTFLWSDWEVTEKGQFRLPKKTVKSEPTATPAAEGEQIPEAAETTVPETKIYFNSEDGIVKITTITEKGEAKTGRYVFDKNGIMLTGTRKVFSPTGAENSYLFKNAAMAKAYDAETAKTLTPYNSDLGQMFTDGWYKTEKNGKERWLYYDNGAKDESKIGQLLSHGVIVTDLGGLKGDGVYLLSKSGYLVKKKVAQAEDGKWYGTDNSGAILKDRFITTKGKKYYYGTDGARVTWTNSWHKLTKKYSNRYFYFGSTAGCVELKTGWQKVTKENGSFVGWFYFNKNGYHYVDKLTSTGYYFKKDGRLAKGITKVNKKTYFFEVSTSTTRRGKMIKNKMFTYKKQKYYANADGQLRKSGWQFYDNNWYYLKNYTVQKNTFEKKNGKYGYLNGKGQYITGWVVKNDANNLVKYINPDKPGYVVNESKWINGKLYYFDSKGYRINDLTSKYKGPYAVDVDRVNGVMTVYADSNRTIPVKTIRVSVGYSWTPTPTGWYTLKRYNRWQSLMGPSWGQYGTHVENAGQGGIFVHSIACGQANSYNLPAGEYNKLGNPASHGCIRVCVADAKWVFDNCNGSSIHIFDGTYTSQEAFKGPLGRRAIVPLRGSMNFDPTDPAVN